MEQNYKITIFTTEEMIERRYLHKKEIAIRTILAYRDSFEDFKIGVMSEKIRGKWYNILSVKK